MPMHDEPNNRPGSEEEAELRPLRRVASAFEHGDIDELAAALYRVLDPALLEPGSHGRPKEK